MAVTIDETLSTSTNTTDGLMEKVCIQLLGTWVGTVALQASIKSDDVFGATGDVWTTNGVYNVTLNTLAQVRADFTRTSGDCRIVIKGT